MEHVNIAIVRVGDEEVRVLNDLLLDSCIVTVGVAVATGFLHEHVCQVPVEHDRVPIVVVALIVTPLVDLLLRVELHTIEGVVVAFHRGHESGVSHAVMAG